MIRTQTSIAALLGVALLTTQLNAAANLQITEMWVGGLEGAEATSDWFEVTNFGDMAATGLDGTLYWDDDSNDPTKDDPLMGIDTIAPGESVIYLLSWEDDFTLTEAHDAFDAMWGAPAGNLIGIQVGHVDGGSGLGGGGDIANIYDGNVMGANVVDSQQYQGAAEDNYASYVSDANGDFNFIMNDPRAVSGVLGAYTGNLPAADDMDPMTAAIPNAIGSPGVVPEPGAATTLALVLVGLFIRRRA